MDQHGGVLARLDDLVEVANRAAPHRLGQRPVDPHRLVGLYKVAADQVAAGQVLVTGDGDEFGRPVGEARQAMSHVLDEAGLTAAGGSLEQHRQASLVGGLENLDLIAYRQVVGSVVRVEMADFRPFSLHPSIELLQLNRHC